MTSNWRTFIFLLASSSATCFFAPSTERKPANTLCPEPANFSAVRRPKPLDAPVTKIVFDMCFSSYWLSKYRTFLFAMCRTKTHGKQGCLLTLVPAEEIAGGCSIRLPHGRFSSWTIIQLKPQLARYKAGNRCNPVRQRYRTCRDHISLEGILPEFASGDRGLR